MQTIPQKLDSLRAQMRKAGVHACIIPGTDPHASEYIADHWKEREWISGFAGSAGTVAVTLDKAGLWTDSRYFLEAAGCLKDSTIELMKMGMPGTPDLISWLISELKPGEKVGVNPQMFSVNGFATTKKDLSMGKIDLAQVDLIKPIWTDRPVLPANTFFVFDTKYTGKTYYEKLKMLQSAMQKSFADAFIITALDDIAWLFNIRGKDVSYNPVLIAYALVTPDNTTLYLNPEKLTPETSAYLAENEIDCKPYLQVYEDLAALSPELRVLIDGVKLNQSLNEAIPAACERINCMSPVFKLKSIKNEVELKGIRKAMLSDGIALTKFFMWLEENIAGGQVTELLIAEKLKFYRSQQENFYGESFGTIAGFADHAAINHYHAEESSSYTILPDNILLIDSGGQYFDGTTDITRTIPTGIPTALQKLDYTLVLKGHIALATAIFPAGTRGSQIDILARQAMWDRLMNYGHGTGHGIGHFLNVHEGPQSIRTDENPTVLEPGMVISNEPGMYRDGEYGFRTENLIAVKEAGSSIFGSFLAFETLTIFPIDKQLIDVELLTSKEIGWLNSYHQEVYDRIAPHLNEKEEIWLKEKTRAI